VQFGVMTTPNPQFIRKGKEKIVFQITRIFFTALYKIILKTLQLVVTILIPLKLSWLVQKLQKLF
jgi:hypothetical protein